MAVKKKGLGKGLDSLIPDNKNIKTITSEKAAEEKKEDQVKSGVQMLKINMVEPNRDQPRKSFEEDALLELADSIKQFGILQPLIVRKRKDYYETELDSGGNVFINGRYGWLRYLFYPRERGSYRGGRIERLSQKGTDLARSF